MGTYGVKNSDILSELYKSYNNKLRIASPLIPSLEPKLNSDKVLEAQLSYYKIREHVSLVPRPPEFCSTFVLYNIRSWKREKYGNTWVVTKLLAER